MAHLFKEGTNSSDTVTLLSCTSDTLTVQLANNTTENYSLTADKHLNLELHSKSADLTLAFAYGRAWDSNAKATVALDTGSAVSVPCSFSELPVDSKLHITVDTGDGAQITWDPKILVIPPTRTGDEP